MPGFATKRKRRGEFKDITGADDKAADTCLERNGWNVEQAISYYFDNRSQFPSRKEGQPGKLKKVFAKYADREDVQVMSEEGMMQFFKDAAVDPEGPETLAIAWHLNCDEMGIISEEEFVQGFAKAGCSSIQDIKKDVAEVTRSLNDDGSFKKFYKWVFIHVKEDEKKKTIPTELAVQLWRIILTNKSLPLMDRWIAFCEARQEKELQAVSRDLWEQIFDFLKEVRSIDTFEDNGAWPIAIDEFVEFLQA